MARVQVEDLSAPEKIRPSPLQSDTYTGAPQPPIDNRMGELASALGVLNHGLQSYAHLQKQQELDAKKAHIEQVTAEYNHYLTSATDETRLADMRSGKIPWMADPYVGTVIRKDYAQLEAQDVARQIDQDIADGKLQLGVHPAILQKYILDKTKPIADKFYDSADAITTFRKGLDGVRDSLLAKNAQAIAQANQQAFDNISMRRISGVLDEAVRTGSSVADTQTAVRKIYEELGGRLKGGSLGQQYGHMDEILLNVLKEKAADPRYAQLALALVNEDRVDAGTGARMGALADVFKHQGAVKAVQDAAVSALSKDAEEKFRNRVILDNVAKLEAKDGSSGSMSDITIPNPFDSSKTIKISAAEQEKDAVQAAINKIRADNGGKPNYEAEIDLVLHNGVKHQEIVGSLNKLAQGLAATSISSPGSVATPQPEAIQQGAQLYNLIADRNYSYLEHYLSKDTIRVFETYTALTRYGGLDPAAAAASTAKIFASKGSQEDPHIAGGGRLSDIESKVKGLDFSWMPFSGGVSNFNDVRGKMMELAKVYAQATDVDADTAIKMAKDRILSASTYVNGRAVFGVPGLLPDDGKNFQPILDKIFEDNKADLKKSFNVGSAKDLSVAPLRSGGFMVVGPNGFPVLVPKFEDSSNPGRPTGMVTPMISLKQVQQQRAVEQSMERDAAIGQAVAKKKTEDAMAPYLPHVMLRDLLTKGADGPRWSATGPSNYSLPSLRNP